MNDIPKELLVARKEALSELAERLTDHEYDIAERAIDLYIDLLER